jgi:hypothetical protein
MNSLPVATEDIHSSFTSPAPLMKLPNELFFEVASHLESFKDLNSLLRTNRFFHTLFNSHLYHRAMTADKSIPEGIVVWVVSNYQVSSLRLLLDNGPSVKQRLPRIPDELYGNLAPSDMLRWICDLSDQKLSISLARPLIERSAVLDRAVYSDNFPIAEFLLAPDADTSGWRKVDRKRLLRRVGRWQKRAIRAR